MSDEPKSDETGSGDLGSDEEPTLVLVSEDFVSGALRRLGGSLQRAGLNCDELADLVSSGAGAAAIDAADADLEDVGRMIAGARRALARVKRGLNGHAKENP